jgi:thiol-disulfide isomerase/thioredoxin
MQKKHTFLQAFRVATFILLSVVLFTPPAYADALSDLKHGQMKSFRFQRPPKPLPEVDFLDAAGQSVKLSSFRGKLVLLTLWATWCPFCKVELPTLADVQELLGRDKFTVLAIGTDKEGPSVIKKYMEEKSINLPAYADPKTNVSMALTTHGIPYSVLIDQDGLEIGRIFGETDWAAPESIELLKAFLR